jgi:hypothetical protein
VFYEIRSALIEIDSRLLFATRNLYVHVSDILTMQSRMAHKALASTMIYLKAVRSKELMAGLNSNEPAALRVKSHAPCMRFLHSTV